MVESTLLQCIKYSTSRAAVQKKSSPLSMSSRSFFFTHFFRNKINNDNRKKAKKPLAHCTKRDIVIKKKMYKIQIFEITQTKKQKGC